MAGSRRKPGLPVVQPPPRIDVLVNAVGSWATVRVGQPFEALQQRGWDVRIHNHPFDLNQAIRRDSLVIWQRPVPQSRDQWVHFLQGIRRRRSLLLLEWDDHPELFPPEVRQGMEACGHAQLQLVHALQCSSIKLAEALKAFHPHPLVVENGVAPLPPLNLGKHQAGGRVRVFLGNLNRVAEHRELVPELLAWLDAEPHIQLVGAGPTGLEGRLPKAQWEGHPLLPYESYREVLASCQLALLPLRRGIPQACKTPIKWLEAAAESTAVVAGPELYGPWLGHNSLGLWAEGPRQMIGLARQLAADPVWRQGLVGAAHGAAQAHALELQLVWRGELYRHLWRLRHGLDRQLLLRWPDLQQI